MLKITDFEGTWQISRVITDRLAGQTGQLDGVATFTRTDGNTLAYVEEGTLQLADGPKLQATRPYRWHFGDDVVAMTFADGSAFHSFVPEGYVEGTEHDCGDDTYAVRYDFIPWPRWRAVWVVSGPRKDYTSVTEFTR
ncbi:DUF6314 family protein [Yoonia sp. 2307UL14-13]|uniref:DUF6314 family protein n=1 Tax=Yoonia sp. 2307UL14-13 TaxID=3126506 RepID=UPI0030A3B647